MTTVLDQPADLLGLVGRCLGSTDWMTISQQQVNLFAGAPGDRQCIHPAARDQRPIQGHDCTRLPHLVACAGRHLGCAANPRSDRGTELRPGKGALPGAAAGRVAGARHRGRAERAAENFGRGGGFHAHLRDRRRTTPGVCGRCDRAVPMTAAPGERPSVEHLIGVLGQQIRVNVRPGSGIPLVLCNGIGASLEVLDPLVAQLHPDTTVVRCDVPGSGASPNSPLPYGFPYLAAVLGRLLKTLGFGGPVDVLGLSWGGALALQFAFQHPRRCRRLILVSTGTGAIMVPGRPSVLARMLTPRRFLHHDYAAVIAGHIYGGTARTDPAIVKQLFDRQLMAGSSVGYLHQLFAGSIWTSIFALPLIRQDTLVVAGTDDPIVPVATRRILHRLLPHSTLHLHGGGHLDLDRKS